MSKNWRFETLAIHGGVSHDPATLASSVPISRTSGFVFKSVRHGADLFALKESGYIYSRLSNPTVDALEQRITLLEGGAASVAVASGNSAVY